MTIPIFIIGSGRSGTKLIADTLAKQKTITCHHQYNSVAVQRVGALYNSGKLSATGAVQELDPIYYPAVNFCETYIWCDVSNKATWVTKPLSMIFDNAKFIRVIRDGRAVIASYLNKLADNHYYNPQLLIDHFYNEGNLPPLEERYWWPVQWGVIRTQFEWACWHWVATNSDHTEPPVTTYRLEDITARYSAFKPFCDDIGVDIPLRQFRRFQRPHNVITPTAYKLSQEQERAFWEFPRVAEMMAKYGYEKEDSYGTSY